MRDKQQDNGRCLEGGSEDCPESIDVGQDTEPQDALASGISLYSSQPTTQTQRDDLQGLLDPETPIVAPA